jgi:multidrug resistance efflux pump
LLIGGAAYGGNLWYQHSQYVTTNNASITAPLIPVTTLSAGQIISLDVDVGSRVERGQRVAEVGAPRFSDSTARQGFQAAPAQGTAVEAPVSGFVAAVWTYPGAIVSPGIPIVTLFDSSNIWVSAKIDETQVNRVHPGQTVEVSVDSLGGTILKGKVTGISPATAANFSLLPQNNTDANFIKVGQVVPVKITLENTDGLMLIPGSSVEVKIFTR